ncbi:MAG: hypothetical protein M3O15_04525 [Acidobacteriota bacterium]|nr:hypothetical protein [Acidobacteriota bacterium]
MIRSRVHLGLALVATLSLVVPALGGGRLDSLLLDPQQDCTEFQCADGTMGWCCGSFAERRACLCNYCGESCLSGATTGSR